MHERGLFFDGPSESRVVLPYREIAEVQLVTLAWHSGFRVKRRDGTTLRMLGFAEAASAYLFVVGKLRKLSGPASGHAKPGAADVTFNE